MKSRRFARRTEPSLLNDALRWCVALALMVVILVIPDHIDYLGLGIFQRAPLELPVAVFLLAVLQGWPRRLVRVAVILLLALILIFKLANMAVFFGFDRPFNPMVDLLMAPVALDTLAKSRGLWAEGLVLAGIALVIVLLIGVLTWATGVIVKSAEGGARTPIAVLALAALGFFFTPYGTFAASAFVRDETVFVARSAADAPKFRVQLQQDPFSGLPVENRLAGLKGKDVLLVFVESYGRSALDRSPLAGRIKDTLQHFDAALREKGFSARSAWVKSPTFGGESYLAHSTLVSGLWIENQQRYTQLLGSSTGTLIRDFGDAGWRTVTVMPEITMPWPEADFFHFSKIYAAPDLGYKGEPFEYITMPDQFTLSAFQARELAAVDRPPVMAEIALVTSHLPWAPIPKLVPWDEVGDGTIFTTARTLVGKEEIWDAKKFPEHYALTIDYALQTLMSFVTTYADDNTVLIILGDHQPISLVAGEGTSHEVPIHMIAKDPAVLAAIDDGAWTAGMLPNTSSPSWPMAALRGHILEGFTPKPDEAAPAAEPAPATTPPPGTP